MNLQAPLVVLAFLVAAAAAYYDVNPRHGTKEEFKHLVAAIHAHGLYVIMDWVPNHTSWGNELIWTHTESI